MNIHTMIHVQDILKIHTRGDVTRRKNWGIFSSWVWLTSARRGGGIKILGAGGKDGEIREWVGDWLQCYSQSPHNEGIFSWFGEIVKEGISMGGGRGDRENSYLNIFMFSCTPAHWILKSMNLPLFYSVLLVSWKPTFLYICSKYHSNPHNC